MVLPCLLKLQTSKEAFDPMYGKADWEADFDQEGERAYAYPEPKWLVISLDFFRLPRKNITAIMFQSLRPFFI